MNGMVITGKRKEAIAKATIKEGNGIVTINKRPISFLNKLQQLEIGEPIVIYKKIIGNLNFDAAINVRGGGSSAQVEASRLALSRAMLEFSKNEELKNAFLSYDRNLLIADTRRKEARKPGDSKARAKRQTSYR